MEDCLSETDLNQDQGEMLFNFTLNESDSLTHSGFDNNSLHVSGKIQILSQLEWFDDEVLE